MRLSLRKKIWLYSLAPLVLIAGAMLFVVQSQVERRVRENAALDLETAAGNLESQLATRERDLATMAFVISRDPKFFAMLSVPLAERGADFAATIRDVALDFHRAVGRDLFDLFDERGRVLTRVTDPAAAGEIDADLPGVREAISGRTVSGIIVEGGRPYQVAIVPVVVGGEVAGVLRVGQAIDATLAEGLRVLTRSEVSIVWDNRVVATTLRGRDAAAALAAALTDLGRDLTASGRPFPLDVGGEIHLTKAESVGGMLAPGQLTIVLQRSLRAELAFLRKMEQILALIGVAGALAAVIAGLVVARGVTAPLMRVVKAGEDLERGNFDTPLAVTTGDEVESLARQFITMRESIRSSITRLEELDRMKSNFITIASHELRTPVTALKGFLYLLQEEEGTTLTDESRELVDGMEKTMEDLTRIVQEVTDMSLLDRRDLPLHPVRTSVRELVEAVVEANGPFFRRRRLGSRTEVEPGLPPVMLDRERIAQALQNLVSNAIRFTPDGGTVVVSGRRTPSELLLSVRDTGIGIPESECARIFDRIYEIGNVVHHSSGTIEFGSSGIGLGLPIAKGIVEAHGGRISVESGIGAGSSFTIRLPWGRVAVSEEAESDCGAGFSERGGRRGRFALSIVFACRRGGDPVKATTNRCAWARAAALLFMTTVFPATGGVALATAGEVRWHGVGTFTLREEAEALNLNRFNYQDSMFDPFRIHLMADAAVSDKLSVFGQLVIDDSSSQPVRPHGYYAMLSNFAPTDLSIEVGKVPTVFGTFGPRAYANKNPLIAPPLFYQYHTALRGDQLPLKPADLVKSAGMGQYGIGFTTEGGKSTGASSNRLGIPIVYDACWDFGVVALGTWRRFEYAVGLTHGTVGIPSIGRDSNDGQQVVGRIGFVPVTGFRVTGSAAQGSYLNRAVTMFLPPGADLEDYKQTALGLAADWSWSHWELYGELLKNEYESPWITEDLGLVSWYAEAKYAFAAGAYFAARFDKLTFDEIAYEDAASGETKRSGWDKDLQRIEAAIGYRITPAWQLRYDVQLWDEDGGTWGTTHSVSALQAVIAF